MQDSDDVHSEILVKAWNEVNVVQFCTLSSNK